MTENTQRLACTVAYLIGTEIEICITNYSESCSELLDNLRKDKQANIIRSLSILNTQLINNFPQTASKLYHEVTNIDKMDFFDQNAITFLKENGIDVLICNAKAEKYRTKFLELLDTHIDSCKSFFPDWVKWQYIRSLFVPPKYNNSKNQKYEYFKFLDNKSFYPYQKYLYWKNPRDIGNMLSCDKKLLKIVYSENFDEFYDDSKCEDATNLTKSEIYDFINNSVNTIIAVDCENSDCYKMCEMLKSLKQSEMNKIRKIILYDDIHTTSAWQHLHTQTDIPVEIVNVERVLERKSIVDIKMTAGVCQQFYEGGADSFIICSSDSDFWGLISSLPKAKFIVMYENEKCSTITKDAFFKHNIGHISLDDFGNGNISGFKKTVLLSLLDDSLPKISINAQDLTDKIYSDAQIQASELEKRQFIQKYIKTLQIRINEEGNLYLALPKAQ